MASDDLRELSERLAVVESIVGRGVPPPEVEHGFNRNRDDHRAIYDRLDKIEKAVVRMDTRHDIEHAEPWHRRPWIWGSGGFLGGGALAELIKRLWPDG